MTTNQISKTSQSSKLPARQQIVLSGFLGNISLAWKMILMASVFFLGTLGVATAAYGGLQSLRYQFSNIYDFMLIPINSINDANTSLEEAQRYLVQVVGKNITAEERTNNIAQIQVDNQAVEKVIARYDTEWVTTTSPQFTRDLKNAGKIDLQQQEVATLASYHKAYDAYKATFERYLATVQAGSPDANLAKNALTQIQDAQAQLQSLINVNLQFADFSNTSAQACSTNSSRYHCSDHWFGIRIL
jgi:methyl-accepting chemotaxis protein